jgi:hypothetical protein
MNDIDFIKQNINVYGKKFCCEKLEINRIKLEQLIIEHNIYYDLSSVRKRIAEINNIKKCFKFTDEHIGFIKENIHLGKKYCSKKIKCTLPRLNEVIEKHNIPYNRSLVSFHQGNTFKVGSIPKNKGIKVDKNSELYKKLSVNFFKKGHTSPNQKYEVGQIYQINYKNLDYWYVYLGNNKKTPYKKWLWEQSGNTIPKGFIVVCRNLNFPRDEKPTIDDLICINRRIWQKLHAFKDLPNELIETKLKIMNLNFLIKNREIILKNK